MSNGNTTGAGLQGLLGGAGAGAAIGGKTSMGAPTGIAIGAGLGALSTVMSARAARKQRQREFQARGLEQLVRIKENEERQRQNAMIGLQQAFAKALS